MQYLLRTFSNARSEHGAFNRYCVAAASSCDAYLLWVNKGYSGIKDQQQPDPDIRYNRCRINARPIHDRLMKDVLVVDERLKVVPEFCYIYLHDMLSAWSVRLQAGCDYKLQV